MWIIELFQQDYTLRIVSIGSALLGMVSGVVGSFAVLKKQGLLGDAVSHAALPGIAIAFLLFQTKSTIGFMIGALITGLLATGLITLIEKNTRIKVDSAMALVLSVFFGVGLVLLTYIQKIPNANQAGLERFIFGQASTMLRQDVYLILVVGTILLLLIAVFWKEFKVVTFDPEFADSIGFSSRKVSFLLSSMIVISIIIGLQTVGVILMSAMLVAPGVAARQWSNRLSVMVGLAGFFGAVSGFIGTLISSSIAKMPTGPTIVLIISVIVLVSLFLAPNRGILWSYVRERKQRKDVNEDKVLSNLYELGLNHTDVYKSHTVKAIKPIKARKGIHKGLRKAFDSLEAKGFIIKENEDEWAITDAGIAYITKHPLRKENANVSTV